MIIIASIGYGSTGVWVKFMGPEYGIFAQTFTRSLIVLLMLIPIGIVTKQFRKVDKGDWKWIVVPVLFGVFTQAPIYYSFNLVPIGTSMLLFFAAFLITSYLYGYFFLKEKISIAKKVSLALAALGLVMVFGIELGGTFSVLALVLAIINGVANGGEVSSTKKLKLKYSSIQIIGFVWAGILLTHLPAAMVSGDHFMTPVIDIASVSMLAYALVGLFSFWLVVEGFRHVDANMGGLISLSEVIFSIIFGIILFSEPLGLSTITGGGLIILAAMLPDLIELLKKRRAIRSS